PRGYPVRTGPQSGAAAVDCFGHGGGVGAGVSVPARTALRAIARAGDARAAGSSATIASPQWGKRRSRRRGRGRRARAPVEITATMPRVAADRLHHIGTALLEAAGASTDEAEVVMRHCIDANLAGHDSHGIIQIPTYIDRIQVGHIVPGAPWTID